MIKHKWLGVVTLMQFAFKIRAGSLRNKKYFITHARESEALKLEDWGLQWWKAWKSQTLEAKDHRAFQWPHGQNKTFRLQEEMIPKLWRPTSRWATRQSDSCGIHTRRFTGDGSAAARPEDSPGVGMYSNIGVSSLPLLPCPGSWDGTSTIHPLPPSMKDIPRGFHLPEI